MGVVFANIVNTKFIYYEIESEGVPFVEPEASCGDILVVAGIIEALGEEIIGDLSRLWKVVDAFAYLKLHPTVWSKLVEIVFENKFLRDIQKAKRAYSQLLRGVTR